MYKLLKPVSLISFPSFTIFVDNLLQIIFRARRNHLLEKYGEEDNSPEKILEDVNMALEV